MKQAVKYLKAETNCLSSEWVKKGRISSPPSWCSIDLMDGNRATAEPMTQFEKEEYFKMLTEIGIRQINIGNPAAQNDFAFVNSLIQKKLIPDNIYVQVNVDADKKSVREIMKELFGMRKVILNLTSYILIKPKDNYAAMKKSLFDAIKLVKEKEAKFDGNIIYQFTIEFFREADTPHVLEIFNDIADFIRPNEYNKIIFNLAPVNEYAMPHTFVSSVEYISKHLHHREGIILSLRPSNDCGTAVSTAEMSILAGVERIEGTLFGIGERVGNADIINLAMNLYSQGVNPKLKLSNIPAICEKFERCTGIHIYEKYAFSGELAFSVFSTPHQIAIGDALHRNEDSLNIKWDIPYLIIDPRDIGRDFDSEVLRSDGLSGRGSINYILNKKYGFQIPSMLQAELADTILSVDDGQTELNSETVYNRFKKLYIDNTPIFTCPESFFDRDSNHKTETIIRLSSGNSFTIKSEGSGRLDAVGKALQKYFDIAFDIDIYEEHSLTTGSSAETASYVSIKCDGETYWGVGINPDLIKSSVNALTVAVNQLKKVQSFSVDTDPRLIEMLDYIKDNYDTVTLSSVADRFYLSKQYVSKYIREKSGLTFCENVQNFRMKKAEEMLLTTNMTVEAVAEKSGYPSVEHFNRRFKKLHGITPVQFRKKKN